MRYRRFVTVFFITAILCGWHTPARGESVPWELKLQLREAGAGEKMKTPLALTVDPKQRRYFVADAASGIIVSFDGEGTYLATLRGGSRMTAPVAVARTSTGKFWVVNRSSNQLFYIDPAGREAQTFSPRHPSGAHLFADRLALDDRDRLFLLDRLNGSVLQLDDHVKAVRTFRGPKGYRGFNDFKAKEGRVWALDGLGKTVYVFGAGGEVERTIPLGGTLQFPVALEVDEAGRLYVLDRHAGAVQVFDGQGRPLYDILSRGKGRGELWYGTALMFDWEGRLCVVDEGNGKVEVFGRR